MLPVAQGCVCAQPASNTEPDPTPPTTPPNPADPPPAGLHLLPSELLAHIVRYLCTNARHAFVQTGRHVHRCVARDVVIARLERRIPQVATLSTLQAALPDVLHLALTEGQRARWIGRLAGRLPAIPPHLGLPGARALLDQVAWLPAERRGKPLIALMNGMSFAELLDPWDDFRDGVLAQIMALPPALQGRPLARYLHLLPASELNVADVRAWIAHVGRLPEPDRGLLLTKLAESSVAFETTWKDRGHADLLCAAAALPASERAPVLSVVGVNLGRALDPGHPDRAAQALRCWLAVLDAARALPETGASDVLDCLATHLSRAAAARAPCWETLWTCGIDMLQMPEHRASWLAGMAHHACTGANWTERWQRVWQGAAALPPMLLAPVAHHLAHALREVADYDARRPRWDALLELAPTLPSAGRAKLLKRLAAVLQTQPTGHDESNWDALLATAKTLEPLDEALVLIACMDDAASAEGLWGAHLRKYALLTPGQVAKALVALAAKLPLLPCPERRTGACLDMLRAISLLPVPLQRDPAVALAGPLPAIAADGGSVARPLEALLSGWPAADRSQWLVAASMLVSDVDEAVWLIARLALLPSWLRAWPIAELASWAARHADLEDDVAGDLWIGLCVAATEIPPRYRSSMLPAMEDFGQSLPDRFRVGARRDLNRLRTGVPACDLPQSAGWPVQDGTDAAPRGVKRGWTE